MTRDAAASFVVGPARPGDLPAIEALLSVARLPLDGAAAAFSLGVVAREAGGPAGSGGGTGRLIAAAAVERYGSAGLLRSVVVAPDRRGAGVGRAVVGAAEALARAAGIGRLHLLTETAADWFATLGYAVETRDDAAAEVGASAELRGACPETAVAMRRALG